MPKALISLIPVKFSVAFLTYSSDSFLIFSCVFLILGKKNAEINPMMIANPSTSIPKTQEILNEMISTAITAMDLQASLIN